MLLLACAAADEDGVDGHPEDGAPVVGTYVNRLAFFFVVNITRTIFVLSVKLKIPFLFYD